MFESPLVLALFYLVVIVGGAIQGLTGFGFGLVTVPIFIIFMEPRMVVPMDLIHGTLQPLIILFDTYKSLQFKRILPLMIAGICGLPLGAVVLQTLDGVVLKLIIGLLIVVFGVAFLSGFQHKAKKERIAFLPIGFISGLLNSSTALSGPPIILFFTNQGLTKQVFRANIVGYFIVLNLSTYPVFIYNGLLTTETVKYALILMPGMLAGVFTGIKLASKINEQVFRRIALIVVIIAGLISAISGFRGLIN